jgi:hypothetical protein
MQVDESCGVDPRAQHHMSGDAMTQSTQPRRQKAASAPAQKLAAAPKQKPAGVAGQAATAPRRKAATAPKQAATAPRRKAAAAPTQKPAATAGEADAAAGLAAPALTAEQLGELLALIKGADSVELKLSIPEAARRSALAALDMDPLDAQMRQVVFFDTPALTLNQHGLVVRARRIQGRPSDSVVKLRPVVPDRLPATLRRSSNFGVEVDAMPGGFVCSGSMKAALDPARVKDVLAGLLPTRKLFTKEQRSFFAAYAPSGVELDGLTMLGPVTVFKLKFKPVDYGRRLVAELWNYPDGSRILELSTKCAPAETFTVVAETRVFLASRGIDLLGEQQTKTRSALEFFAKELAADNNG